MASFFDVIQAEELAKAKANPKAKAKSKASPAKRQAPNKWTSADFARARVDKCAWCEEKRQGWCDRLLVFYCEHCWTNYDTLQAADGDYAGKVWHDEILEEDNIAAEGEDDDGGNVLEFTKNALNQIESDMKKPSNKDADDSDECHEEDDEVKELPNPKAFGATKPPEFELQQAHVVVIVDTSGSMRTYDVKPENASEYITRMAAVTLSLSTFFEKQVQSCCPHKFLGLSFQSCKFKLQVWGALNGNGFAGLLR